MGCYMPANGESVSIPVTPDIQVDMSVSLLKRGFTQPSSLQPVPKKSCVLHGALVIKDSVSVNNFKASKNKCITVLKPSERGISN